MKIKHLLKVLPVILALIPLGSAHAFYNPATGRWLSRDPIGETAVSRPRLPVADRFPYQVHGQTDENLFTFTRNALGADFLGMYTLLSEGYAFRDPKYLYVSSIWWQKTSKVQMSAKASYNAWASPLQTSICNSGLLREDPELGPYPPDKTSYVKAYLANEGGCSSPARKYRVSCFATLAAGTWGRASSVQPQFKVLGQMLGEGVQPSETTSISFSPDSDGYVFVKSVTKTIVVTGQYTLYYLFMPVALQVKPSYSGGFLENGFANCEINDLGAN